MKMKKNNLFVVILFFSLSLFTYPAQANADTPEQTEQYKYALGLIKRQLYEEASKVLSRIISTPSIFSNADGAVFWLAECEYRQKHYTKAEGLYSKLLSEFPNSIYFARATYGLGWAYSKDNNPKSAIEAFSKVSKNDDIDLWIDANLKRAFLMNKYKMQPNETIKIYSELLKAGKLTNEQRYECNLQIGIGKFNKSIYKQAIKYFEASLKLSPNNAKQNIYFYIAESNFRSKNFKEAIKWYSKTISENPTNSISSKSNYSLAWCHIKTKNYDSAIKTLNSIIKNPKNKLRTDAANDLIELYMNLHKYEAAIELINRTLLFFGKDSQPDLLFIKGLAQSRIGRYDKSIATYQNFLKLFPRDDKKSKVLYQCGLSYISINKFKKALDCFAKIQSAKIEPTIREKAIYRTGECYFNLGNLKAAGENFNKLLRIFPNGKAKYDTLYQLGELAYISNRYSDALAAFDTISRTGNELGSQATFRAGEVLMKSGNYEDAIIRFSNYLKNYPGGKLKEDAIFKTGLCYVELKDQGQALAAFSQLKDAKGYFRQEARYQIGEIARKLGNYTLAIQQYKAILSEEPKHPLASRSRRAVGICLYKLNDYKSACEVFKKLLKDYPKTDAAIPESQLWLGKSLIKYGKIEDGILEVLKVPVLFPKSNFSAEAYAEAARAYAQLGKSGKSRKMWKEVLKSKPDSKLKKEAKEAINKK